jgi:integral membrane sensor domain MASE1
VNSISKPKPAVALRALLILLLFAFGGLAARFVPFLDFHDNVPLLWLPSAIFLAVILLFDWRYAPVAIAGTALFAVIAQMPMGNFLAAVCLGSAAGAILSAWLLKKYLKFENSLERLRFAGAFLLVAVCVCALINAAAITASLVLDKKLRRKVFSPPSSAGGYQSRWASLRSRPRSSR